MDAPWIAKKELAIGDKNEKLHKEILGFVEYIAPTTKEIKARERLVSDIKYIVDCLWPEQYKTVPFGSVESGLLFPSSDVDINIEPIESRIPVNVKSVLRAIHKRGMKDRLFYFQDTTLILHARIPILTIQRGAAVDVSIANDICSSDRTVVWIKQYPELKPLFMVLKQAISNCKLTSNPAFEPLSAKTNGLASYGLICLIVNYLEHEKPRNIQQKDYYATLLMGFLRFYGQFDETKTAISMQNGGHYYSFGESDLPVDFTGEPGKLVVVDPDKDVNVARSCTTFEFFKLILNRLSDLLEKRMCTADNDESMLSSIIKVDAHYHQEPRREGSDFKAESIVIENGNPVIKSKFKDKFKYNKPAFMHEENRGYVKSGGYYNDKHDNSYSGNRGTKSNQRYSPYSKRTDYQSSSSSPYRNSNQYNSNNNNQHRNNNRYNSNNSNDRNRKKRWN